LKDENKEKSKQVLDILTKSFPDKSYKFDFKNYNDFIIFLNTAILDETNKYVKIVLRDRIIDFVKNKQSNDKTYLDSLLEELKAVKIDNGPDKPDPDSGGE